MATIVPGAFTYTQWALRHDPNGKISTLINLLSQTNDMLDDLLTVECQSGNAFQYTQVVKLPTPSRRSYNQGVGSMPAGVGKQTATTSEYADWSKFDKSLGELGGQLNELRGQEDALHMEGLMQQVASDMWYGSRVNDPTQFTGFANIFNTVNPATSLIANQVLDCGGTGSTNTSMWLITWGPKMVHAIHPKGSQVGLQHRDMGLLPAVDPISGLEYLAYRTWLQWDIGLAVVDYRYIVRACNIDITLLNTGGAANLINTLTRMVHRPPTGPRGAAPQAKSDSPVDTYMQGRSAIYVNRTLMTYIDLQAMNKTNVLLQMGEWNGKTVTTFRGIPFRLSDALLDTESRVV